MTYVRKISEKVIPAIVLKYYKQPKRSEPGAPLFKCAWCFEARDRTGGGFFDEMGKYHQICEICAVWEYRKNHGYKTLTAARARRRRIFDVGYLLNEMVLDVYMNDRGIGSINDCDNADRVFIKASELYNLLFSKDDKIHLEEIEDQKEIEAEISRRLLSVDFKSFFEGL